MKIRYQPWRRAAGLAQAALFLGLPFLRVNGESALRLDVPAGRLHAFGLSLAIGEAFVVLLAVLAATFAFLLGTLVLGRAWCGWSCPQTVLSDLTAWALPRRGRRRDPLGLSLSKAEHGSRDRWRRAAGLAAVAAVSALAVGAFLGYFVPPHELLARLHAGRLGPALAWSWAALAAVLFADLAFVRQGFCATVCPYARLQGVLLDRASLVVAYDRRRAADCVDCGACVRVCPTGIDIRDGLQPECIACAACVDACAPILRRRGRAPGLVGWFLGAPEAAGSSALRRIVRPAAVALAAATALSLAGLVVAVAMRTPLQLEARLDAAFAPRRTPDGRALVALDVELENRSRAKATVVLALDAPAARGAISVRPERLALAPAERRRVRLLVALTGLRPGEVPARLRAESRDGERLLGRRDAAVLLVVPEVR